MNIRKRNVKLFAACHDLITFESEKAVGHARIVANALSRGLETQNDRWQPIVILNEA